MRFSTDRQSCNADALHDNPRSKHPVTPCRSKLITLASRTDKTLPSRTSVVTRHPHPSSALQSTYTTMAKDADRFRYTLQSVSTTSTVNTRWYKWVSVSPLHKKIPWYTTQQRRNLFEPPADDACIAQRPDPKPTHGIYDITRRLQNYSPATDTACPLNPRTPPPSASNQPYADGIASFTLHLIRITHILHIIYHVHLILQILNRIVPPKIMSHSQVVPKKLSELLRKHFTRSGPSTVVKNRLASIYQVGSRIHSTT